MADQTVAEAQDVESSAENTTEKGVNENVKEHEEGTHAIYLRKAIDSTFKKCLGSIKYADSFSNRSRSRV